MQSDIPQTVFYQAAEWYATLYADDCAESERRAWRLWLNSDPLHQLAWQRVEQIHARFHAVDSRLASTVLSRRGTERRQLLKLLVLAMLVGGGAYSVPWQTYAADFRTGKGESRHWTLAEGITLYLNTDSALKRQNADGQPMALTLLKGECLLESRIAAPLRLMTPQGEIALSTPCRIDVRCDGQGSTLAVFDGTAQVRAAGCLPNAVLVTAGQQMHFSTDDCSVPERVEAFRQSWLEGVLLADDMRLDTLMNEYARYHNGYFSVDDKAAALRISGVFPLQDTARFFNALTRTLPITIDQRFFWWVSLRSR